MLTGFAPRATAAPGGTWTGVAIATAVVVTVGYFSGVGLYPVGAVIAGGVLVLGIRSVRPLRPMVRVDAALTRRIGYLGVCWMGLMFVANHRITVGYADGAILRSPLQSLIDIVVYLGTAAVAVGIIDSEVRRTKSGKPTQSSAILALFIFPAWVIVSALWGRDLLTPFVRGAALVITALLATATLLTVRNARWAVDELLTTLIRWYTWTVMVLVVAGFTIGPLYASRGAGNAGRFTWPAAHPGVTGLFLGPAIVILLCAPRRVLFMPMFVRVPAIGVASIALYQNHARTAVLATVLGALVVLWLAGKRRPELRVLGPSSVLSVGVLLVLFAFRDVVEFALRGGAVSNLTSLQGRSQLWGIAADELNSLVRWVVGLGHGASGYVFIDEVSFAGNAHNSALALIVNTGVIGLVLAAGMLVAALVGVYRTMAQRNPNIGVPLFGFLVTLLVQAVTSDALAEPNLGFSVVYLGIVLVLAERHLDAASPASEQPPANGTRMPAGRSPWLRPSPAPLVAATPPAETSLPRRGPPTAPPHRE